MSSAPDTPTPPSEDALRPHSYDGIQEYDKRLPNWWLLTLYATIVFAIVYWFVVYESHTVLTDGARVTREMNRIEAVKLAALVNVLTDDNLWKMSRNPEFTANGAATFKNTCQACHAPTLRGKAEDPRYIGANLVDNIWIQGGRPTQVFHTVQNGIATRGMPPRGGAALSDKALVEVVAFIFSHHDEGEPIILESAAAAPAK
jgi:cytochrome c oxidase cbb3-type subunit 3